MVHFVAFAEHPVERERIEPELHVRFKDLFSVPKCLVFREEDDSDLPSAPDLWVNLEECEPRKLTVFRDPCRKDIGGPVRSFCLFYSPLEEANYLVLVFEPDEDIAHHLLIACDPPDVVEIVFIQVLENQPFCRESKRHAVPVRCFFLIDFIRHD
ncbi:MAG: hypothetical protein A4E41_01734 [Methanoregulaceae archaeon PtaU1.Bin066]|nr:MAG: hypothetical protein A4E41_01734 [Methanoregulaceae archaeon PtaU1.Bin066]